MIRIILFTLALITTAQAAPNQAKMVAHNTCNDRGCFTQPVVNYATSDRPTRQARTRPTVKIAATDAMLPNERMELASAGDDYEFVPPSPTKRGQIRTHYLPAKGGVSLACIVGPLKAKAEELIATCGSKVISAFRPGARIPTGHVSNHALCRALDLQGNPSCMYRLLADWKGGLSTDYWDAPGTPHIHLSWNPGGMEWGTKFAHYKKSWPRRVASIRKEIP